MTDIERQMNAAEELAMVNDHILAAKKTQKLFEENSRPEGVKACEDMLEAMYDRAVELHKVVIYGE